ncbi:CLUMA_CG005076, isoform A [Clunio marinus]|uniref:Polypeptide N-acetylgalactosaminyltransferase n=1 Tax=Clunio marinus TaxID=568069 RepID=A0A1J1HTT0_9DIPT|nr:CLUMA_CG005076, isoform A [Clunio marinus]
MRSLVKCRYRKFYLILLAISLLSCLVIFYLSKYTLNKLIELQENGKYQRLRHNRRIPQIIGHYMGPNANVNLSQEFLNTNNFDPIPGEGDDGNPVIIPSKDLLLMQQLFQINRFNLLASDRMSLNRTLLDVRNNVCKTKSYSSDLPKTTIIIVFHNEAWSVLLRTIWSVITRSKQEHLKEILLIDDASTRNFLKQQLDDYVKKLSVPTKVLRLKQREGLVAARLLGAKEASGDVLTFLDAHCECTNGWLEPLLKRVKENPKVAISPVIDIISDDNFSYVKSFDFHWGAFNWELHFRWFMLGEEELKRRKKDISAPFKSPAMAGGLFAISRDYFFEIGSYDKDMKIWGGDNIEMSLRIWQCGGSIEISPCSHVGHLFRKSSPYTFPGGVNEILNRNLARVADVWMDQWKEFYFKFNRNANELRTTLNTTERIALRKRHECKPFTWYLQHVWKENFFPANNRFFGRIQMADQTKIEPEYRRYYDVIQEFSRVIHFQEQSIDERWNKLIKYFNKRTATISEMFLHKSNNYFCLQKPKTSGNSSPYGQTYLRKCSQVYDSLDEMFIITTDGKIMTNENLCLDSFKLQSSDYSNEKGKDEIHFAKMVTCSTKTTQYFVYNTNTLQLLQANTGMCLEGSDIPFENESYKVTLVDCSENNKYQKWILFPVEWH